MTRNTGEKIDTVEQTIQQLNATKINTDLINQKHEETLNGLTDHFWKIK